MCGGCLARQGGRVAAAHPVARGGPGQGGAAAALPAALGHHGRHQTGAPWRGRGDHLRDSML